MGKIDILKALISIADKCGDLTDMGVFEKWVYIVAEAEDGTKIRFDVNFAKGEEKDGN